MYVFTVRLADADRNVYESLTLRVAQHPSEAAEYLGDATILVSRTQRN
jgi:uncharacterized protein YaeQ